jgi:ribonuclease J
VSVTVTFLGGLGEIGRNCAAIEIDGQIALIDCGLMFPEEDMLGVDLVFPDWKWLVERAKDVRCVILTHGHEDHIGALGYFLREVNVPVYGTRLTLELAASRVEELQVESVFRPVPDDRWVTDGPIKFKLIPVSHSVPDGAGVAFDTPEGIIVHTGDFKLDPTPVDSRPTDLPSFAELGRAGVRLLLSDSTNAERPGVIPSERSLSRTINTIVSEAQGRVIAACFSSHIHRVQQIADAGVANGRYLAFMGRSMERNVVIGQEVGVLGLPEDRVLPIEELLDLPPDQTMIITTGSQGEPFAALSLMAAKRHRWVDLDFGDTVLISATPIPGNETAVSKVISKLNKAGARVFHGRNANVHVSGHAAQEELKTFLNVVRPQAFVPIHGEYRHLYAHADLAAEMNVPSINILEDGDAVVIDGDETRVVRGAVEAGYVYLDGSGVGDVVNAVLRDRSHLADDGVVVVMVALNAKTHEIIDGPDLNSHGFMDEPDAILKKAAEAVEATISEYASGKSEETLAVAIRRTVRRVIKSETRRRPVVLPVVVEL